MDEKAEQKTEQQKPTYADVAEGRTLLAALANKICMPPKPPGGYLAGTSGSVRHDEAAPPTAKNKVEPEDELVQQQKIYEETLQLLGENHPATVALGEKLEIGKSVAAATAGEEKPLQTKIFQKIRQVRQLEAKHEKAQQRLAKAQADASQALEALEQAEISLETVSNKLGKARSEQQNLASDVAGGPWAMLGIQLPKEPGTETQQLLRQYHEVVNALKQAHSVAPSQQAKGDPYAATEGDIGMGQDDDEEDDSGDENEFDEDHLHSKFASMASGSGNRGRNEERGLHHKKEGDTTPRRSRSPPPNKKGDTDHDKEPLLG